MRSWPVSKEKLMFEFTLKNRDDSIQAIKEIDLFEWSRLSWYSYSSLESSAITKEEEKEEKRKIKKKDPIQEYDEYWKDDEVDEWIKSSEEASYEFEQEKIKRNKRAAKM